MTDDELRESLEWRLKDAQGRWLASEWTDFDVRANGIVADMFNGILENRARLALLDPELAKQPGYSDVTNVVTCGMPPIDPPVPVQAIKDLIAGYERDRDELQADDFKEYIKVGYLYGIVIRNLQNLLKVQEQSK
jgi:hypothetical protein